MDAASEEILRDNLNSFVPDLVSVLRYTPFVDRLLARPKGEWVPVMNLCTGLEGAADFFARTGLGEMDLWVIWLDCPGCQANEPFVYIHFYCDLIFYCNTALFNRASLAQGLDEQPSTPGL
jgi:hypothetical protein